MPDNPIIQTVERFRGQLDTKDKAAMKRLIDAYGTAYKRMQPSIDALAQEIARMIAEGDTISLGKLYKMRRYIALQEQIADELGAFSGLLRSSIDPLVLARMQDATKDTKIILTALGLDNVTTLAFERLPREAIVQMLGFLDPNGALYSRIKGLAPAYVDKIAETLLQGIVEGMNPRKVAELIAGNAERTLGMGLTDALRTTRTAQIWSYREATRANYLANSDVVTGWIWWAELDDLTCLSCVANHGQEFPLDTELDDHYNGRCTMIPLVNGYNPIENDKTGEEWFSSQSETTQAAMMGKGKFEAWQDGRFEFSQLSQERPDETYGRMKFETSLKDLIGEDE